MKTKTFDCVQMKRRGADWVRKQLEYWRKGTEDLRKLQQQAREQK